MAPFFGQPSKWGGLNINLSLVFTAAGRFSLGQLIFACLFSTDKRQ